MPIEWARNSELELAYERMGARDGEPLLLIMGMGLQMVAWPDGFCDALGAKGFAVVRYDNRDAGLSSQLTRRGRPGLLRGRKGAAYELADMADDAVAVMDALGWEGAHLFGAAVGGTIAQLVALRRPERVRTLGLAAAYAGSRRGQVHTGAAVRSMLGKLLRRYPPGREGSARALTDMARSAASPGYPFDEEMWRQMGLTSYDRRPDPGPGLMRQFRAFRAAGDLLPRLAGITAPTLVIHGEADPMVRVGASRAIADAIPGARMKLYPGMGHDLPRDLWPSIADELWTLAATTPT
ncbi:alpha/beta fold hydrolase [Nonomuraea sp. NPDC050404]|uniref:alpha/beta fold hydrolase n=1 Tax=Nonomuraea sp. NPDC050404 TaxID=3155783 RepID=UPI0033F4B87A